MGALYLIAKSHVLFDRNKQQKAFCDQTRRPLEMGSILRSHLVIASKLRYTMNSCLLNILFAGIHTQCLNVTVF